MNKKTLLTGVSNFYNNTNTCFKFSTPTYIDEILSFIQKGNKILDFGCGYGRVLDELYQIGFRKLYGIDISKNLIKHAKIKNSNIKYICSDNIDSFNTSFDLIILNNVLVNICFNTFQNDLLNNLINLLSKNGKIVIIDFIISESPKYKKEYKINLKKYNEDGIYKINECYFKHHTSERINEIKSFFSNIRYSENDVVSLSGTKMRQFVFIGKRSD